MKKPISKILLFLVTYFSLSFSLYAIPENNSILRFDSKNLDGSVVYAVAKGDSVYALTADDPFYIKNMQNSLWIVRAKGNNTFIVQNLGTGLFLNQDYYLGSVGSKKGNIHYPILSTEALALNLSEGDKGFYYTEKDYNNNAAYIQYDPIKQSWFFYTINSKFPHDPKQETQANNAWSDANFPQASVANSLEIEGRDVVELIGGSGNGDLSIDDIGNIVVDYIEQKDVREAAETPIVAGDPSTYPNRSYWKTATIRLDVTYEDWTPVSFPIDVKCISNLSGVGYQEYSTANRAEGKSAWVTKYVTSDMVFLKGVAYNFATDSEVMTLEFRPTTATELTRVENSYNTALAATTGSVLTNQNWYYIGNALFVDAKMNNAIDYACQYNGTGYMPIDLEDESFAPFSTFFVQYTGDYAMSSVQTTRNSAPMLAREKSVTEKYSLRIDGENSYYKTGIYFADGASAEDYVVGEDFLSFATKKGKGVEIYTVEDDADYSFNKRPIENTVVRLGLYVGKAGRYTISLDNISGNAESMVLYDTYEQDFARLHLGETYTFDSERGSFDDRFAVAVTYAPGTTTDNVSLEAVNLVVVGNEIQGVVEGADYAIYNSTGSLVYSDVAYAETVTLPNLTSGVYIVRTATGWTKFVVK